MHFGLVNRRLRKVEMRCKVGGYGQARMYFGQVVGGERKILKIKNN